MCNILLGFVFIFAGLREAAFTPCICSSSSPIDDASFDDSDLCSPNGAVETLTCDSHFVVSPGDASLDVTCQSNGSWTEPEGECGRYEFFNKGSRFSARLPQTPVEGWGLCAKGRLTGDWHFILMPNYGGTDYNLRLSLKPFSGEMKWTVKSDGQWHKGNTAFNALNTTLPLAPNQNFSLRYKLLADSLQVTLTGDEDSVYVIPTSGEEPGWDHVTLSDSRVLVMYGDVTVSYLNLLTDDCGGPAEAN